MRILMQIAFLIFLPILKFSYETETDIVTIRVPYPSRWKELRATSAGLFQ